MRVRRYSPGHQREKSVTENHIHAEIGEVRLGRNREEAAPVKLRLYKSVGIAIQDVATAQLLYRKGNRTKRRLQR